MTTRTLVVWCPDWPVTAVGLPAGTPAAVVAGDRVAACSAAARDARVRRGQRLRDAQRRCPGLRVADRDLDAEGRLFETVVAAVTALTPRVEVVRPGVCALPVRGAARFHGGEEPLRERVREAVEATGFDCGIGIADGMFAAELAARSGDPPAGAVVAPGEAAAFLAAFPTTVLDRPELSGLLRRLGIRTLGEFAALPPGRVSERFGADGTLAHRLARGVEPRPPAPRSPGAELSVRAEFSPAADRADEVIFAAKRLAGRLHARLEGDRLICARLLITAAFDGGATLERLWRHDGTLSDLAVAERVRWQLSAWRPEPADDGLSGGGVVALELAPDRLSPWDGHQATLWGRGGDMRRIARAADRIQAMLGHQSITRPVLTGGRGPADQVVRVPVGDLPLGDDAPGPWPGRVPAPTPAMVPAMPSPAEVTDATGRPITVSARCVVSAAPAWVRAGGGDRRRVMAWTGPWPEHDRWWDPDRERRLARFQVVTAGGDGYLLTLEGGQWHVEAVYD